MRILAKKTFSILLVIAVLAWYFLVFPKVAWAADASETFDYADQAGLSTQNGGTGFGAAWSATINNFTVQAASCRAGGTANCVNRAASTDGDIGRDLSASVAKGSVTVFGKAVTGGDQYVIVACNTTAGCSAGGAAARWYVNFSVSEGQIKIIGTNIVAFSTGTWYEVDIEFNGGGTSSCTDGQVRARVDNGTWTACVAMVGSGETDIDEIDMEHAGAASRETWVDDITITEDAAAAVIELQYTPLWMFNEI